MTQPVTLPRELTRSLRVGQLLRVERELSVSSDQYADALTGIGPAATDRHFMAEYDGHTLYAGGEGCFSLQTTLTPDQLHRLGQAVLDLLGMDHHIELELGGCL